MPKFSIYVVVDASLTYAKDAGNFATSSTHLVQKAMRKPQAVALGFLLFSKLGMRNLDLSLEDLYAKFAKKYKDIESTGEFEDFFERIQIKTCSEAVCETVGSIMTMAKGEAKYIFVLAY